MSANPIMQCVERSSWRWAGLALSLPLLAGCHASVHHGAPPHPRMMIGFTPLLLVVTVFLLVMLVKRPWKTLGGLLLAFVVFAFLGLLIPRLRMRQQTAWNMPATVITETHHEAFEGPDGQLIVQSWSDAQPHSVAPVSSSVTKAMAVAGTEEHEVVSSESAPASETPPAPEQGVGGEHAEGSAHEADEAAHAAEHHSDEAHAVSTPAPASAPPAPAPTAPPAEAAAASTPAVPAPQPEIPPGAEVVEKAPDWIHEPAHLDPRTNTYVQIVKTGTATTPFELHRKLDQEIAEVTRIYLSETIDPAAGGLQVPMEYLRQKVVKQQHTESVRRQFSGPAGFDDPGAVTYVQETWARLEYGPDVKRELQLMWDQHVAERRLWQVGGLGALVMGVLASALGYLRLDTATKGFYTRTLRWGAAGVILALVAAAFVLVG